MSFRELVIDRFGSVYACAKHFGELPEKAISGVYIYKLAAGECGNVTIKMVPTLCKELGVDVIELMESFGIDTGVI